MTSVIIKSQTNKTLTLQEIQKLKAGLNSFFDESWKFEIDYSDLDSLDLEEEQNLNKKPKAKNSVQTTKPSKTIGQIKKNPKIEETTKRLQEFWAKEGLKNLSSAEMKKTQSKIHQIWQGENKNLTFTQKEIDELSAM